MFLIDLNISLCVRNIMFALCIINPTFIIFFFYFDLHFYVQI